MLGKHSRAALQFSGGKDSLALLYLARPHLDRITVFFGDTGGTYPHVRDFVMKTCAELGVDLVTVRPYIPVLDYHAIYGLPVDVLPLDSVEEMRRMMPPTDAPKLQAWTKCCTAMLWLPLEQAIRERGHTLILRGAKACDPHVPTQDGVVEGGVEYRYPLWEWSHDKVMDFLDGKPLPPHYPAIMDSMDCWTCTATLTGKYAEAKLEYAKAHYPELWPLMKERLLRVHGAVAAEVGKVNGIIERVTA